MSYRILVTLKADNRTADFIVSGYDFGDVLRAKHRLIEWVKDRSRMMADKTKVMNHAESWYQAIICGCDVALCLWESQDNRTMWITTWADREYVVDLGMGKITSPEWSAIMDADQHDKIYA